MKNSSSPFARASTWVLALMLLGLIVIYGAFCWTDILTDLGGDSAGYLVNSRLYSPYHAASPATLAFRSAVITPPLFPMMLALVDGGYHFLAAHLLVAAFAVASCAALHFWLKREGFQWWIAAAITLLFALLPATMQTALNIWTEYPYLFFSMAAIAILTQASKESRQAIWYGAAVMVACATMIRVAALPLLAAFLLYLVLQRPRKWIVVALVATLPFVIWALYSSMNERGAGAYVSHFADVYASDPIGKLIRQCRVENDAVFREWKTGWLRFSSSDALHNIVTGFWYVCIAGWLYRLVRLKFDAIYGLLYVVQLFLWPHPEEAGRYSFVLYPLFIGSGFLLVQALPKRIAEPAGRPYLAGCAVGVMALTAFPAIGYTAELFNRPLPQGMEAARHITDWYTTNRYIALSNAYFYKSLFQDLGELQRKVAPDQCVYAIKPTIVTLFADRIAKGPPPASFNDEQFNAAIPACRYAYVMGIESPSYPEAYYPQRRLGDRAKVISQLDDTSGGPMAILLEIGK